MTSSVVSLYWFSSAFYSLWVKYVVDPTHMKPGEGSLFVRHLSQQTLHIDVWDGDSLLLIGSSAVELKHLCRQGREAVQVSYELDIMSSEVSEDKSTSYTGDLSRGGSVRPVGVHTALKGKLHLRLANVGHPVDPKFLPKSRTLPNALTTSVIKPEKGDMQGSFIGGSLSCIQNTAELHRRSAKASHLRHTNTELASLLHSRQHQTNVDESLLMKNKKLARMAAVRDRLMQTSEGGGDENSAIKTLLSFKHQKAERARDLKIMEAYRSQSKADGIRNMLNQAITTEHVIHPSMGSTEFFEYQLSNPNNSEVTISIRVDCDEISVITDAREWRHFKQLYKLDTPIEEGMFNTEVTRKDPEVFLRPKETVYIPMKYVSYEANHNCSSDSPGLSDLNSAMRSTNAAGLNKTMSTRLHKIHFNALGDNKLIAILALKVEPEPHVIDQTFRFHQPEQSFLKKSIRLPPFQNMIGGLVDRSGYQQLVVKCSDANVICESYKRQTGEPQDVFIKAAVGASPQQKKFFVCIYSDMFMSKPDQIWQFYVHALQRVDVGCVEGQTTRISLILRGTQSSRLVRCFTSHPGQMQVLPNEAFMLAAGAVHELHVGVKPLQSGTKFLYLNVVDLECHQLVRNWLVCVTCSTPVISKTFELQLPADGGKGSNKRISFTNPYSQMKTFILSNNRNDLLQFKETRLEMHPKETRVIGLRFMPALNTGSAEILIFINDNEDKNEETFRVKVNYIAENEED
ncbi:NPHP4 [Bugula neritina]|uniref:NPHP4 n=1 Tax=Bugula neritina TaxID=10212 RepID=A0A7J7IU96_BUGNE|nr:NPHP4 [Bugula neritina]